MNRTELSAFLDAGRMSFDQLESETSALLSDLEVNSADQIQSFIVRRHEIIDSIQKFDTEFKLLIKGTLSDCDILIIEKFKSVHAALLRRVIELDGLLVAMAERHIELLKSEFASLSSGRTAIQNYSEVDENPISFLQQII